MYVEDGSQGGKVSAKTNTSCPLDMCQVHEQLASPFRLPTVVGPCWTYGILWTCVKEASPV